MWKITLQENQDTPQLVRLYHYRPCEVYRVRKALHKIVFYRLKELKKHGYTLTKHQDLILMSNTGESVQTYHLVHATGVKLRIQYRIYKVK